MPMASTVAFIIIKVFIISFMAIAAIATLQQESGTFLMGMACGVWIHRFFDWLDEKIWRKSND